MSKPSNPKTLGYRFPAEWEAQAAVWFAWPIREDLWAGCLEAVRDQLAALYVLAANFQPVRVLCPASAQTALRDRLKALEALGDTNEIELFDYATDDVWIRDFGPLFLVNDRKGECCIADWRYNAWGNKFPQQEKDDAASAWIAEQLGIRRFAVDHVLEGGAVESNGAGQLLTTEVVLLNPNRNGATTTAQMERRLSSALGIDSVLWLQDGLVGDDTDGHIDNLARFFKADGILIADVDDPEDANHAALAENIARLQEQRTPQGQPYALVQLPLPAPLYHEEERLAASYLNFIVLNGAVLVPTYQQPSRDAEALEIIADCFPGREVHGFDCTDIIKEGGALHCMSQHQPL